MATETALECVCRQDARWGTFPNAACEICGGKGYVGIAVVLALFEAADEAAAKDAEIAKLEDLFHGECEAFLSAKRRAEAAESALSAKDAEIRDLNAQLEEAAAEIRRARELETASFNDLCAAKRALQTVSDSPWAGRDGYAVALVAANEALGHKDALTVAIGSHVHGLADQLSAAKQRNEQLEGALRGARNQLDSYLGGMERRHARSATDL